MNDLSTETLQSLRSECREVIKTICHSIASNEQVTNGIRQLATSDDMCAAFHAIAENDPEHAKLVLHAAVAALVNIQSETAIETELKRRSDCN